MNRYTIKSYSNLVSMNGNHYLVARQTRRGGRPVTQIVGSFATPWAKTADPLPLDYVPTCNSDVETVSVDETTRELVLNAWWISRKPKSGPIPHLNGGIWPNVRDDKGNLTNH